MKRTIRPMPLVASATLLCLTAACGLSPAAATALQRAQVGVANGSGAGSVSANGTVPGGLSSPGATVGNSIFGGSNSASLPGAVGPGSSGSYTGTGATASSGPTTGSSTGATTPTSGSGPSWERTGITASTIYIGLHAPQTGAAPIPLQAFATGAKLFWENHTVFGHRVQVIFENDQYNASVARSVCEQLSRETFLVVGGAGTDQIQACATDPVLAQTHTPYLSAGVTTNGLTGLFNYFAITQTYAAQTPEVWTMAQDLYPANAHGKWAIITEDTPNFNDVTSAMAAVLRAHGIQYTIIRTPKAFQQSDADNAMAKAEAFTGRSNATVFEDVDPNFYIDMVQSATKSLYSPAWVGPGITVGENLVAGPVCGEAPNIQAAFLSPFFGLDRQPPGFTNENNPAPDAAPQSRDIEMDIYATNEVVYYMLESLGSIANLTRDNFIKAMTSFKAVYGQQLDVYPTINFAGGHFGSTGSWVERLDCTTSNGPEYVTYGNAPLSN